MRGGKKEPTFHILIVTKGRKELVGMLDSLKPQLHENDGLTIVFDGKNSHKDAGYTDEWIRNFRCKVNVIHEDIDGNLSDGEKLKGIARAHKLRNMYHAKLNPVTTYTTHADDDDYYIEGAFDILRAKCTDPSALYIYRINTIQDPNLIIPKLESDTIEHGNISFQCGIIPYAYAGSAEIKAPYHGDFLYYEELQHKVPKVIFMKDIIYSRKW